MQQMLCEKNIGIIANMSFVTVA